MSTAEIRRLRRKDEFQRYGNIILAGEDASAYLSDAAYDRGRRDMLNAILALNPDAARKLHSLEYGAEKPFTNTTGQLPFDVVFWVTEVADQLGIQPKDEGATDDLP